jgi:hypothetical protein
MTPVREPLVGVFQRGNGLLDGRTVCRLELKRRVVEAECAGLCGDPVPPEFEGRMKAVPIALDHFRRVHRGPSVALPAIGPVRENRERFGGTLLPRSTYRDSHANVVRTIREVLVGVWHDTNGVADRGHIGSA